jgi:hypothetical protein
MIFLQKVSFYFFVKHQEFVKIDLFFLILNVKFIVNRPSWNPKS